MADSDPRIDAYIANAAPFAQPILVHLRAVVHGACTDVDEDIKWGMPGFLYRGVLLASMAAFKRHASFAVWTRDDSGTRDATDGMGQYGKLVDKADLPPVAQLENDLRAAMAHVDARKAGRMPARPRVSRPPLPVPDALALALVQSPSAHAGFEAMAPGCRREYIAWINDAKRPETRARRIAQTVQQAGEGRSLHWKHQR